MEINRAPLAKVLANLKPALNDTSKMEELSCVWFNDGTSVSAYNDVIGIHIPFDSALSGGVRGSLLYGILDSTTSETLEATVKGETLHLKSGMVKAKFSLLSSKRQVWKVPPCADWMKLTPEFFTVLESVLISAKKNSGNVDYAGIKTFENSLYSTDSATMSRGISDLHLEEHLIPALFWENLVRLSCGQIAFTKQGVQASNEDGVILFSRYLVSTNPLNYQTVIDRTLDNSEFIPLPPTFGLALERASMLLAKGGGGKVEFHASGTNLTLTTNTLYGTLEECLELSSPNDTVLLCLDPALLKRVLPHVQRFYLTEEAAIFENEDSTFLHLVAALPVNPGD